MNKFILILFTLVLFLTGCAEVPDNVKTNNKADESSENPDSSEKYISVEDMLAKTEDVYNNDYGQIKLADGLDLDYSDVTELYSYTLNYEEWDKDNFDKVIKFFQAHDMYTVTEETDCGTAIDGDWVQYSDSSGTRITFDYRGFTAINLGSITSDSCIVDSFNYGDEKCSQKYPLFNGDYSFEEVNSFLKSYIDDWAEIDGDLPFEPAEIFVWELENGKCFYEIYYAKAADGIKFNYQLSSMLKNSDYMYLNILVSTYGEIMFWSNNNGVFNVEKGEKLEGSFVSLDGALKMLQKKFTPYSDFTVYEAVLSYEMVYDKSTDCYKTIPCWKFNLDDNSTRDEYTHRLVKNVFC